MKKNSVILRTILFLLSLIFLFGSVYAQKIETVDGVKVIHNDKPKWGKKPKVALEYVRQIGEFDAEDENYQFYQPRGIVKDKEGNIYILDGGNHRIQKFDKEGNYLLTIGQKGKGPGEMEMPLFFNINGESHIYLVDMGNYRVQKYSSAGEDLGSFKTEMFRMVSSFCFLKSGELLAYIYVFNRPGQKSEENKEKPALFSVLNSDGELQRSFGKLSTHKEWQIANYINSSAFDTDKDDNIYAAFGLQNKIEKYSPEGVLLFTMDRPLKFKVNHKMVKRKMTIRGETREMDFPELTSVSNGLGIDHKSRIWVETVTKQGKINNEDLGNNIPPETELEIFDNEGILLGKLPLPEQRGGMKIIGDRIYMINMSEEMCIYEYKIVDK